MLDDDHNSLLSLLGLLDFPAEYFVTVDHSLLWQRHIAWAKTKGEDLRSYITQRHASMMVFLSCLLAAQINVFFNSSKETTAIRAHLYDQDFFVLKYWIGVTIMSDICVTILALFTTYTLSRMIASISDANAHAMLRSSIGTYVAGLPSRFTVAAMYLFLLWIMLVCYDFFQGPMHFIIISMVFLMFFQVVVPLSAFGRLIIHTGAMGRRPVLDKDLEKELLPSGLHASLLIRATDRKRKYSNATDQYRKQGRRRPDGSAGASSSMPSYPPSSTGQPHPPRDISINRPRTESDDITMDGSNSDLPGLPDDVNAAVGRPMQGRHRRIETMDTVGSDNLIFPGAAILNASVKTSDIKDVVQRSISLSTTGVDNITTAASSVTMSMGSTQGSAGQISEITFRGPSTGPIKDLESGKEKPATKGLRLPADARGHRRRSSSDIAIAEGEVLPDGLDPSPKMTIQSPQHLSRKFFVPTAGGPTGAPPPPPSHPFQYDPSGHPHAPHPLLANKTSPPGVPNRPPTHRPPKRHHERKRSSASRRSTNSLIGFTVLPLPHAAERELAEENAVRAAFDVPPAVDLDDQERLVFEESHLRQDEQGTYYSNRPPSRSEDLTAHGSHNSRRTQRTSNLQEEETPLLTSPKPEMLTNRASTTGSSTLRRHHNSDPALAGTAEESTHLLSNEVPGTDSRSNGGSRYT